MQCNTFNYLVFKIQYILLEVDNNELFIYK